MKIDPLAKSCSAFDEAGTFVEKGSRASAVLIIGSWLILLYPLLIWGVLGTLSGYGFQEKAKDRKTSVRKILADYKILNEIRREKRSLRENAKALRDEILAAEIEIASLTASMLNAAKDLEQKNLILQRKTGTEKKQVLTEEESVEKTLFRLTDAQGRFETLLKKDEGLNQDEEFHEDLASFDQGILRLTGDNNRLRQLGKQRTATQTREKTIRDNLKRFDTTAMGNLTKGDVEDFAAELDLMDFMNMKIFAEMPNQLLTLTLTLAMGALGSLIYITRDFFNTETERSFSWFLFRPFLGMVTAVAIFILAAAGQITISEQAGDLNPYFISFLAIISGLLSEHAIERIKTAAAPIFQNSPDSEKQKRYGVRLADAMAEQEKTPKDIEAFFHCSVEQIEDWVKQKKPVPFESQRIFASFLRIPVRELFTDLRPRSNGELPENGRNKPSPN